MKKTCKNCVQHEVRRCCGAHACKLLNYEPIRPEFDATNDDIDAWLRNEAETCIDFEATEGTT